MTNKKVNKYEAIFASLIVLLLLSLSAIVMFCMPKAYADSNNEKQQYFDLLNPESVDNIKLSNGSITKFDCNLLRFQIEDSGEFGNVIFTHSDNNDPLVANLDFESLLYLNENGCDPNIVDGVVVDVDGVKFNSYLDILSFLNKQDRQNVVISHTSNRITSIIGVEKADKFAKQYEKMFKSDLIIK